MAGRRALKAVLIDLSGTLHIEDTAVPGAQDALNRSQQAELLSLIYPYELKFFSFDLCGGRQVKAGVCSCEICDQHNEGE